MKYNTQQPNTDEDYSAESEFYQEEKRIRKRPHAQIGILKIFQIQVEQNMT